MSTQFILRPGSGRSSSIFSRPLSSAQSALHVKTHQRYINAQKYSKNPSIWLFLIWLVCFVKNVSGKLRQIILFHVNTVAAEHKKICEIVRNHKIHQKFPSNCQWLFCLRPRWPGSKTSENKIKAFAVKLTDQDESFPASRRFISFGCHSYPTS